MQITLNTVIFSLYLKRFAPIVSVFLVVSGSCRHQACRHFCSSWRLDLAFKFFLPCLSLTYWRYCMILFMSFILTLYEYIIVYNIISYYIIFNFNVRINSMRNILKIITPPVPNERFFSDDFWKWKACKFPIISFRAELE